ncbi:carboxypeptidase regulatory-like domain-containing protein [Nocardioides sp. 1609]|uniref:carboxypeptidase regulatory-like domain-containing protein n=1 Tax=Nocardioides sp. 1609 TaxID=2508327 RepID=UPI0010702083|nr:carboxypeptidase regulatory-like domain-containing protein [Nocardioides sp. 1609]
MADHVPHAPLPPGVTTAPVLRTAAGVELAVPVTVTNTAASPRVLTVTPLGVDPGWVVGPPQRTTTLGPGASQELTVALHPPQGTLPASYPLVVTVQALDPATGLTDGSRPGLAETTLLVNPRTTLSVSLEPAEPSAVAKARFTVVVRNGGSVATDVGLSVTNPSIGYVKLRRQRVTVPAQGEVRIGARARMNRPRMAGYGSRAAFAVTANAADSVRHTVGTLHQRALLGPWALKAVALVAVLAVWAAAALTLVPMLSEKISSSSDEATTAGATTDGEDGGEDGGSDGGSGGEDGGADGGAGAAPAAAGGPGLISGTMLGEAPAGVTVRLESKALVDESMQQGVRTVGVSEDDVAGEGKRLASAAVAALPSESDARTKTTPENGAWAFQDVRSPGYYLLTMSKPGYQTQRFVVNSASEAAKEPLEVEMVPGSGALQGRISGPDGPVGGAQVTITDGINTVTTSSNSQGNVGAWSITGLSTPSTYVVIATRHDMSSEATSVRVDPEETRTVDLTLTPGVALLTGKVKRYLPDGSKGPLLGATVSVSDGEGNVRTATTLTEQPQGKFFLSGVPVPGSYTVTISAPGFQSESRQVDLVPGRRPDPISTLLLSSSGRLVGDVTIADKPTATPVDARGRAREPVSSGVPLRATGLVLTNNEATYKTTSSSGKDTSSYVFTGVEPGVYSLTAEYFGYVSRQLTVRVTAGGEKRVDLVMEPVADGVLPQTSTIRGTVVDVATAEPIRTCDDGRPVDPEGCLAATLDENGNGAADPEEFTTRFGPEDAYTLPDPADDLCEEAITAGRTCGIAPGLYTVLIEAPGYLPKSLDVQVAERSNVTAPVAELTAVPSVTGRVSLAPLVGADLEALDPQPNQPVPVTCVWMQVDGAAGALPDCTAAVAAGTANDAAAQADVDACLPGAFYQVGAQPGRTRWCAAIGADDRFTIEAPRTGAYTLTVVPADPEYVVSRSGTLLLDGGAEQYNPVLNRLGQIVVTSLQPEPVPGDGEVDPTDRLVPSDPRPTLSLAPAPPGYQQEEEPDPGVTRIYQVQPGTYNVTGTSGAYSGTEEATVAYNQVLPLRLALIDPIPNFVGRVVGRLDGALVPLSDIPVRLRGATSFSDEGVPAYSVTEPVTGSDGCFAVEAREAPPLYGCTTGWNDTNRTVMRFLTDTMNEIVVSGESRGWEPYRRTKERLVVGAVNTIELAPAPVDVDVDVTVTPPGTTSPFTMPVTVTVDDVPNGRTVTARLVADPLDPARGVLQWDDQGNDARGNALPVGRAIPGTYPVTIELDGYVPFTGDLVCEVGGGCAFDDDVELRKLGEIELTLKGRDGEAVNGAVVRRIVDGAADSFELSPTGNVVTYDQVVPGTDTRTQFAVRAAGYAHDTTRLVQNSADEVRLDCKDVPDPTRVTVEPGGTTRCDLILTRLGTISGDVLAHLGVQGGTSSEVRHPEDVVVTAALCTNPVAGGCTAVSEAPGEVFTATTDEDGAFVLTGTNQVGRSGLAEGTWVLTAAVPGFDQRTNAAGVRGRVVQVGRGVQTADVDVYATAVALSLTVKDAVATVDDASVVVRLTQNDDEVPTAGDPTATLVGSGTADPRYVFGAVVPGTWTIVVTGPTIIRTTQDTVLVPGDPQQEDTVTVERTEASIEGVVTVGGSDSDAGDFAGGATVTLTCTDRAATFCPDDAPARGTDGQPLTATVSAADGTYQIEDVPTGRYVVTFAKPGFETSSSPETSFPSSVAMQLDHALVPTRRFLDVTLTSSAGAAENLSGTELTLDPIGGTVSPELDLTLSAAGTGSFQQVRSGCYQVTLTQGAGHLGTVSGPTGTGTTADCPAGAAGTTVVRVPDGTSEERVVLAYEVEADRFAYTLSADAWDGHPEPTTSLRLVRTNGGGFDRTVPTPVTAGGELWVPPGQYDVTPVLAGVPDAWWPVTTSSVSVPTASPVVLALAESTFEVTVRIDGFTAGDVATVQVSPGTGQDGVAPSPALLTADASGQVVFTLPHGAWLFEGDWADGPDSVQVTVTGPTTVTLRPAPADPVPDPDPAPDPDPEPDPDADDGTGTGTDGSDGTDGELTP